MYPTSDFLSIARACAADDALQPGDERYVDLAELREGTSVLNRLAGVLEQQPNKGQFHRCLLTGHRGSGKSTELLELKEWAGRSGWLCLWVEVETYLGTAQLEFSDLYLLAAQRVVQEMEEQKMPLPKALMDNIVAWFALVTEQDIEKIKSEISAKADAQVGFGALLNKLVVGFGASVAAGSEHQLEVKRIFRQTPDQLMDLTNALLDAANRALNEAGRSHGLLLIFDNLDRYAVDDIQKVLTQSAALMHRLECHAIYTIPVELRPRAANPYSDNFATNEFLPMPALRERGEQWKASVGESPFREDALSVFQQLLEKRLDLRALFERPDIDPALLVKMSGGCVRDLMHLVTRAGTFSYKISIPPVERKITSAGVQRAVLEMRDELAEGLLEDDYKCLVKIAERVPEAQNMDEATLGFLSRRRVLRYQGADGCWLDVHPLLVESEGFKRHKKAQSEGGRDDD